MTTVYPQLDLNIPLADPVDQAFAANRAALATTMDDWAKPLAQPAAQVRAHRTELARAIHGLSLPGGNDELLDALARLDPVTVVRLVGLVAAARAAGDGQPRHTPPLTLTAGAVEAIYTSGPTTQIQVADGRDERTWYDIAVVLECEEGEEHDHAAKDCVVVLSDAWADGGAHLPADWDLSVRIEVTA